MRTQTFHARLVRATIAVSVTTAVAVMSSTAWAATTLRFGHANNNGEIATDMFQEFADNVKARTNGAIDIRVYPAEQLGKEVDLALQVKSGALDISAPSLPALSSLLPGLEIASAPFLWKDWDEADKIIRGPAFQPMFDELADKQNVLMLTKTFYWGWRNLTTREKAVRTPADMSGLKIRVPESPVWVEMVRALGAAPTPIPFGEVYTALQQHTVDGQENPIPTIFSRKFYEVQGYLSLTRHMLQSNSMIINKKSFEKLSPEQQKILLEEAAKVAQKDLKLQQEREVSMLEDIRKSGKTQVIEDVDRDAFAAKMGPVYDKLASRWGADNLKRVQAAVKALRGS